MSASVCRQRKFSVVFSFKAVGEEREQREGGK